MSTLLLRLAGPMQSWGTQSRFHVRETGRAPSKSGVVGLLCAALGRPRPEPVDDLASLRMGVRVDRAGVMMRDYHTALHVVRASGASNRDAVTSNRYYLADADFLVGLEGSAQLLQTLHGALADPTWPMFLGRKAFVPSLPIQVPDGLRTQQGLEAALRSAPWYRRTVREEPPDQLQLVFDADRETGEPRQDVPLSFAHGRRRFTVRYVRTDFMDLTEDLIQESPLCISPS